MRRGSAPLVYLVFGRRGWRPAKFAILSDFGGSAIHGLVRAWNWRQATGSKPRWLDDCYTDPPSAPICLCLRALNKYC